MTREKAIKVLEQIKIRAAYAMWENVSVEAIEIYDALGIAINTLKSDKAHKSDELAKNILAEIAGLDANNHSLSQIECKIIFGKGGSENEK